MKIKFKDDVLTYIDLKNTREQPTNEFQYSFMQSSILTLNFEKRKYIQFSFEKEELTPIEVSELIEFLIDNILSISETITTDVFFKMIEDRFIDEDTKIEIY